jgi:hypothetical protein
VRRSSPVLNEPADPELVALCDALADGDPRRRGLASAPPGDAAAATSRGFAAITLTARPDDEFVPPLHHRPEDLPATVEATAIEASAELAVDLVRLIDRSLARAARAEPAAQG